jgi:hypothetical protein
LGSDYNGGLFPVWIALKEPVMNAESIRWKTGTSIIAYRTQAINSKNLITADTAFLYWDEPPPLFVKIDSTEITRDTAKSWKLDTTYYHRDTVFAIVDGQPSLPIVIEVKNILPRIRKVTLGGVEQPGDSLLTIAAHPGDRMEIFIHLENPFNNAFHTELEMPEKMSGLRQKSRSDSLWVYEWTVPNEAIADSSIYLRVKDSGGYGERLYKVYLVVYTEFSSVWVASDNELVKYSPTGAEVVRISDGFNSISAIAVNSNNGKLFVTDHSRNSFAIFDYYGKPLYKNDSSFKSPTGVAVDVERHYVWIADETRLHRYALLNDTISFADVDYEMFDPVKGLSINQFEKDFVWFTIPEVDTVGFIRDPVSEPPRFIPYNWNRPYMVSHDPSSGIAWIADSSRIVAIDTTGRILANISGFKEVRSVSASGGSVWAADIQTGTVYRFKGPFSGSPLDLNSTINNGMPVRNFLSPVSISAFSADGGAWVVDNGRGMVVRLDSNGRQIAFGTGLTRPTLGLTLQKVD